MVIKISQGSVVTQTALGELTIHPPVTNSMQYAYTSFFEKMIAIKESYCDNKRVPFYDS